MTRPQRPEHRDQLDLFGFEPDAAGGAAHDTAPRASPAGTQPAAGVPSPLSRDRAPWSGPVHAGAAAQQAAAAGAGPQQTAPSGAGPQQGAAAGAGPQQAAPVGVAPQQAVAAGAAPQEAAPAGAAPQPAAPADRVPDGAPPLALRHPRAQREVALGAHRVGYELRRSRRRSIGFSVGADGLSVAAPRWVGQREIDAALREKSSWILRKLAEQRDRARRLNAARVDWRDGATIPFLGEPVTVVLDACAAMQAGGALLDAANAAPPGAPRLTLLLDLPQDAAPQQIRDAVQSWLQRQARRIFEERCRHFAARLGVQWRRLALSSAQTRWGSASADGSVRLNWRLVHFGMPTIDYVVAHELAHLRHMDHSPRFWDVVRSVVPDVEGARGALRGEVLPVLE